MSDTGSDSSPLDDPEPGEDAGINAIRLDAERTRNELEDTLDQIEEALTPKYAVAAGLVVVAIVGVVVWIARSRRG